MPQSRILHYSSIAMIVTGSISIYTSSILAQSTNASCLPSYNWMDNSEGQSPCLLGAYLQGACNGGQFTVSALPPGTYYAGPYADQQNTCQCSSVTYSVVSACGLCQNHTIISWAAWNTNCSTVYPGVYPSSIPGGTAIPRWAFQDVTASNFFNLTLAQLIGDSPESVATTVQSTGFASIATPTSAPFTATPSPSSSASFSNKSNAGVIAGSVVGSIVGVALIAGLIFLVMKKMRSRTSPPAQFVVAPMSPLSSSAYVYATSSPPGVLPPKLYDPSDPSTFPVPLTTGVYHSDHSDRPDGAYLGRPII